MPERSNTIHQQPQEITEPKKQDFRSTDHAAYGHVVLRIGGQSPWASGAEGDVCVAGLV
ncbi:hypothetical protein FHS27_006273 [Rhodopirellula rubra]|uniref:Uncharacterized protein n=1 Tax=Aporhodopirellula rubra TaxID=980271 RepID=A0A7W5H9S4_9BACT|nr:hypothetical protein [Aporhodopirellula rubra]MBB3210426.1 hypothetical protein [Aporhodopirellula rubra]